MRNSTTLRTSVSPTLLKWRLFLGSFFAICGASLILYAGVFAPQKWGFLLFLFGMGLIALGLIPYRLLQRLEIKPNELELLEHGVIYRKRGEQQWQLPYGSIQRVVYFEDAWRYGIQLTVENHLELFLPYFTQRSCTVLQSALENVMHSKEP